MSMFPSSLPGIGSDLTMSHRDLFIQPTLAGDFLPTGRVIDGTKTRDPGNSATSIAEIRPGLIMGKVTASGKYANAIIGVTQAAIAANATAITLTLAAATEVVRRIGATGTLTLSGPPTTTGTLASQAVVFTAVNTTTGVVTCNTIAAASIAGSFIGDIDGSQTPVTFFCHQVTNKRVTDINGNSQDVSLAYIPVTNKTIYTTNLVDYPSNAVLKSWIKSSLRTSVPGLTFDDDF